MKKLLEYSFNILLFFAGLYLIFSNRNTVGLKNLGLMILGLTFLFYLLYSYNKKYK